MCHVWEEFTGDDVDSGYSSLDSLSVTPGIDHRIKQQRQIVKKLARQLRYAEWRLHDLERIRRHYFGQRFPDTRIGRTPRNIYAEPATVLSRTFRDHTAVSMQEPMVAGNSVVSDVTVGASTPPIEVSTATAEGNDAVPATVLSVIRRDDTGVSTEEPMAAVNSVVSDVTASTERPTEVSTATAEGNIFMKAVGIDIPCRERSEEEIANISDEGIFVKGQLFTPYEFELLINSLLPTEELLEYDVFMRMPQQLDPMSHSCVHFRGLPKGMAERQIMAPLVSFNWILPREAWDRAVIAVKCLRIHHEGGTSYFNGLAYVTFANRKLAEVAIEFWDYIIFDDLDVWSRQVSCDFSHGPIYANADQSLPGAGRVTKGRVFDFHDQVSMDRQMHPVTFGTLGFPARIRKSPIRRQF